MRGQPMRLKALMNGLFQPEIAASRRHAPWPGLARDTVQQVFLSLHEASSYQLVLGGTFRARRAISGGLNNPTTAVHHGHRKPKK